MAAPFPAAFSKWQFVGVKWFPVGTFTPAPVFPFVVATVFKDGDKIIGNRTKIKVVKNKVAAPFREAEVDVLYGEGVSREGDLLDLGVQHEIVEKSGSWFSFAGERIGQGRENARTFLLSNPETCERLNAELRKKLGLDSAAAGEDDSQAASGDQLTFKKAARSA